MKRVIARVAVLNKAACHELENQNGQQEHDLPLV